MSCGACQQERIPHVAGRTPPVAKIGHSEFLDQVAQQLNELLLSCVEPAERCIHHNQLECGALWLGTETAFDYQKLQHDAG
mmetsp:Transcript_24594/g.47915  ORF Transcript_24594/g.47915 Transcript_24594/m.47915 type:complete len:81 (-) Transcript_24594:924-1166(-)